MQHFTFWAKTGLGDVMHAGLSARGWPFIFETRSMGCIQIAYWEGGGASGCVPKVVRLPLHNTPSSDKRDPVSAREKAVKRGPRD